MPSWFNNEWISLLHVGALQRPEDLRERIVRTGADVDGELVVGVLRGGGVAVGEEDVYGLAAMVGPLEHAEHRKAGIDEVIHVDQQGADVEAVIVFAERGEADVLGA